MKHKLILEIEAPDELDHLASVAEIQRAITRGFYEYFGNWSAQNMQFKISSAEDKPLDYNNLERAIRRDVVDDDALIPLALKGIQWEKVVSGNEEDNTTCDIR